MTDAHLGRSTDSAGLETHPADLRHEILAFIEDRVSTAGAEEVTVVLDGGVESTVAATLLVDSLGAERVHGLLLPCNLSTEASTLDATAVIDALGIASTQMHLHPLFDAFRESVMSAFDGRGEYVPQDVVISRLRMTCAYFVSATTDRLVVGTASRTCRLLGAAGEHGADIADLQPIGHLYDSEVRALGRHLDLPEMILDKPATGTRLAERDGAVPSTVAPEIIDRVLVELVDCGRAPVSVAEELSIDISLVRSLAGAVELPRRDHSVLARSGPDSA